MKSKATVEMFKKMTKRRRFDDKRKTTLGSEETTKSNPIERSPLTTQYVVTSRSKLVSNRAT